MQDLCILVQGKSLNDVSRCKIRRFLQSYPKESDLSWQTWHTDPSLQSIRAKAFFKQPGVGNYWIQKTKPQHYTTWNEETKLTLNLPEAVSVPSPVTCIVWKLSSVVAKVELLRTGKESISKAKKVFILQFSCTKSGWVRLLHNSALSSLEMCAAGCLFIKDSVGSPLLKCEVVTRKYFNHAPLVDER